MLPASPWARLILAINTLGLLGYAIWLVFRATAIFYTQEGVLYLLPGLPFFFVYAYLLGQQTEPEQSEEGADHGKGS